MISLIHPSFGRPYQAYKCFKEWESKSGAEFEYILSLDRRDPTVKQYKTFFADQHIIISDSDNCVQATNVAAEQAKGDILVYLSDDFSCPPNWTRSINLALNIMKPQLLKVDDGLQPFHKTVLTIPIMTRKLYSLLSYFWNPLYKSMWVDVDLYYECEDYLIKKPKLLFQHNHYTRGAEYDTTYQQHDNLERQSEGLTIFNKRAKDKKWDVQF